MDEHVATDLYAPRHRRVVVARRVMHPCLVRPGLEFARRRAAAAAGADAALEHQTCALPGPQLLFLEAHLDALRSGGGSEVEAAVDHFHRSARDRHQQGARTLQLVHRDQQGTVDQLPQVSLGIQHKRQKDFLVPSLIGAARDEDTEAYLAASRLLLGGAFGYNLLLNGNLRYSRANELGLLGFGGDRRDRHSVLKEGSVAVLFNPRWALGVEYREKPDNLSFAGESDWSDVFLGYFPNKNLAVVLAYARLGEIAGLDHQDGAYLSIQGSF